MASAVEKGFGTKKKVFLTDIKLDNVDEEVDDDDGISQSWLSSRLDDAERALKEREDILTKLRLRRKQQEEQQQQQQQQHHKEEKRDWEMGASYGVGTETAGGEAAATAVESFAARDRLAQLENAIESLSFVHDLAIWTRRYNRRVTGSLSSSSATTTTTSSSKRLSSQVRQCNSLGLILIKHLISRRHPSSSQQQQQQPQANQSPQTKHQEIFQNAVMEYKSLHRYTRAVAITTMRRLLRSSGYLSTQKQTSTSGTTTPNRGGWYDTLKDQFDSYREYLDYLEQKNNSSGKSLLDIEIQEEEEVDEEEEENVASCCVCLIKLQIIHNYVMEYLTSQGGSSSYQEQEEEGEENRKEEMIFPKTHVQNWDVIVELVRPIVDRVRYHFLDFGNASTTTSRYNAEDGEKHNKTNGAHRRLGTPGDGGNSSYDKHSDDTVRITSSRIDRLPEWLIHYIRDVIISGGSYDLIVDCIQPQLNYWMKRIDLKVMAFADTIVIDGGHVVDDDDVGNNDTDKSPSLISTAHKSGYNNDNDNNKCYMLDAPSNFLHEIIHLVAHVLRTRNYFHHPIIAGVNSTPLLLCNALEQLLLFDRFIQDLFWDAYNNSKYYYYYEDNDASGPRWNNVTTMMMTTGPSISSQGRGGSFSASLISQKSKNDESLIQRVSLTSPPRPPPRLMDILISSDPELLNWWIDVERSYAIRTLYDSAKTKAEEERYKNDIEMGGSSNDSYTPNADAYFGYHLFSPAAETFVALLRSAQFKSNAFGAPFETKRIYVGKVIVPLCMEFMDAVHASATELKSLLSQRRRGNVGGLLSDDDLMKNTLGWIDVVTSTNLASAVLLRHGSGGGSGSGDWRGNNITVGDSADEDLHRMGRSLVRLRDAMVDDFGTTLVETVVMERARLASYLMRCPHMLSLDSHVLPEEEENEGRGGLSPDLNEAAHVLSVVIRVCEDTLSRISASDVVASTHDGKKGLDSSSVGLASAPHPGGFHGTDLMTPMDHGDRSVMDVARFAPHALLSNVAYRVEEKFMEIAVDAHGMTPDICLGGAKVFRRDFKAIATLFGVLEEEELVRKFGNRQGQVGGMHRITLSSTPARAPKHRFFQRLLDVLNVMAMEVGKFRSLREVLRSLVRPGGLGSTFDKAAGGGRHAGGFDPDVYLLSYDEFASDGTILDEAYSMLRAKGFQSLQLEDVISIMNRRRE